MVWLQLIDNQSNWSKNIFEQMNKALNDKLEEWLYVWAKSAILL